MIGSSRSDPQLTRAIIIFVHYNSLNNDSNTELGLSLVLKFGTRQLGIKGSIENVEIYEKANWVEQHSGAFLIFDAENN